MNPTVAPVGAPDASSPSTSGEQLIKGIPSWLSVRSSSIPRKSANIRRCRFRQTQSLALAAAMTCRASSTHAPSSLPSRLISSMATGVACVMSSNGITPTCMRITCQKLASTTPTAAGPLNRAKSRVFERSHGRSPQRTVKLHHVWRPPHRMVGKG